MMKIFGTIDIFSETSTSNSRTKLVYGAWVASENFYRAILEYGTFDEYHFFVNSKLGANLFKKSISRFNCNLNKIKIINTKEISTCLQRIKYTVFFTTGIDLSKLAYLRSKFAKENFSICGMVFQTISYSSVLWEDIFNNMISDLYHFDSFICTSSAVYRTMRNLNRLASSSFQKHIGVPLKYNGRLDYLPFGINADDYGKINKLEARKKLGLAEDKIIILYFGRFSLYDKADLYPLLVAFKEILAERRNIMLLLAGVDAQSKYGVKLQKISKEMNLLPNVKFILGYSNEKKKKAIYSASDIFISPSDSIQESFGITVLEAMASGLPVIGSDWNGYKDLIVHNETGFRIPTYWADCNIEGRLSFDKLFDLWQRDHLYLGQSVCVDIKKMMEYLSILVKNKELRLKFGQNARNRVLKTYDWKVVIPSYEKLWEKLSKLSQGYKIIRNQNGLFMPKYFDSFSHYPTRILGDKTRMMISRNGLLFLKTKKLPFKIPEELEDIISIKIIFMVLTFLLKKNNATIAEIEKYTKAILNVKVNIIRYNIIWLLKKGLLEQSYENKN